MFNLAAEIVTFTCELLGGAPKQRIRRLQIHDPVFALLQRSADDAALLQRLDRILGNRVVGITGFRNR